jgi:hypothetical protein
MATFPGKGLVVDVPVAEGGDWVIPDDGRIKTTTIERFEDLDRVYRYLRDGTHEFKWVGLDSVTAIQMLARKKTVGERDLEADPHMTSMPEYGKVGELVTEAIYKFASLPLHVIWTAQEKRFGRDDDPRVLGPAVIPSLLETLMPSMLLVGRLSIVDGQRRMRLRPHPDYHCKVRARAGVKVPDLIKVPEWENGQIGDVLGVLVKYLLGRSTVAPEPIDEAEDGLVLMD